MFNRTFMLILVALNIPQQRLRCRLNTRYDFPEPCPVVIRNGRLLEPTDSDGNIDLDHGDTLTISCVDKGFINHPNTVHDKNTATITCDSSDRFSSDEGWLSDSAIFKHFTCSESPDHGTLRTNRTCYDGNPVFEVGYEVEEQFYPHFESCFNEGELNVLYSKYTQKGYNANFRTRVERPFFKDTNIYMNTPVESLFSPRGLKSAVGQLVGPQTDSYFTNSEYLSRGHLAAKTDFVFPFGQRATFHYVNCAPQWVNFNGGNWNTLEVDLRLFINVLNADTIIYTGTYGVTHLLNEYDQRVDIYLYTDENNNPVIPVPMYYYKVVYVPATKMGTAFVGINNPHYTPDEMRQLVFCEDKCRDARNYSWLTWSPDSVSKGYSFCCTIRDFRMTVPHLPDFEVDGMFPMAAT